MKVLEKGTMSNGTPIQIEEWNEDYSFMPYGSTLASYPKSRESHGGQFEPKLNKTYRFSFDFESVEESKKAFNDLLSGVKTLVDFKENLSKKEYVNCI